MFLYWILLSIIMSWKRWSGKIQIALKCYSNIMQNWNRKGPFYKLKLYFKLRVCFRLWISLQKPSSWASQSKGCEQNAHCFSAHTLPLLNTTVNTDYWIRGSHSKINTETNSFNCYQRNFATEHYENSLPPPRHN